VLSNESYYETTVETDEYDDTYFEPDFNFMYEFGTNEQVISGL